MFENRVINGREYESRFIASWVREGGGLRYREDVNDFYNWLISLGLTEEQAKHIKFLATNGKLELENSARKFLNKRIE